MNARIRQLAARADARGASFEVTVPFPAAAECHVATIRPGQIRGNHFHTTRRELLVVMAAGRWTLFWDDGEGTPVQQRTFEGGVVEAELDPCCAHAVRNDGTAELQIFVLGDVRVGDTQRRVIAEAVPRLAGIDGCGAGWLAVMKGGDAIEVRVCRSAEELRELFASCTVAAIDIPIGLAENRSRACDDAARKFLRGRASSVFSAPLRALLGADNYPAANRLSRELQGKGFSKQAWMITPKIAQVDGLLRDRGLRQRVVEVHPEVSFTAWNGGVLAPKKSEEGASARWALVTKHFGEIPPVPPGAKGDDLLDAFAALWTAERVHAGRHELLGGETDATGLPMRIAY